VLERDSVDADELFSRRVATLPIAEGFEQVRRDVVHPPLYYGLLHVSMKLFGDGGGAMRLPSLLAGLAIVGLVVSLGARAAENAALGLLAGLLVAVSEPQIFYSAHARGYALYALLVLLVFASFVAACREPERRGCWAIFAGVCALAGLTHYMAWLYVLVTLPVALVQRSKPIFVRWAISTAAAGSVSLVWVLLVLPVLRPQIRNLSWIEPADPYSLLATYARFAGLPPFEKATTVSLLVGLFLLCSATHALWRLGLTPTPRSTWIALLLAGAVLPPALLFSLAAPPIGLPIWGYRHVHPSQACWAVSAALGAWHCFGLGRWCRAGAVAAAVSLPFALLPDVFRHPIHQPLSQVAARVSESPYRSLPVFSLNGNLAPPVNFYLRNRAPVEFLPREAHADELLPARFVILYRKEDRRDLERLASLSAELARRGALLREVDFISTRPEDPWGTTIAVVEPGEVP
jgi:hypothetical protein